MSKFPLPKGCGWGPMQTVFNKKTVCPKPFWAHAFVSGLFFCSTFDLYKNLEDFCRGQFFFHAKPWAQEPSFCRRPVGHCWSNKKVQNGSILVGSLILPTVAFSCWFRLLREIWHLWFRCCDRKRNAEKHLGWNVHFRRTYRAATEGLNPLCWCEWSCALDFVSTVIL